MPTEIKTTILINATPNKVWNILTDFNAYPNWNPFIKSISGAVKIGQKIKVEIAPPDAKKMIFKPEVLILENNKHFSWIGHLLFPGIFDGQHHFELIDNGDGTTTFNQSERFTGILVPLFKSQLNNNTARGFNLMNEKLKEVAEQ